METRAVHPRVVSLRTRLQASGESGRSLAFQLCSCDYHSCLPQLPLQHRFSAISSGRAISADIGMEITYWILINGLLHRINKNNVYYFPLSVCFLWRMKRTRDVYFQFLPPWEIGFILHKHVFQRNVLLSSMFFFSLLLHGNDTGPSQFPRLPAISKKVVYVKVI